MNTIKAFIKKGSLVNIFPKGTVYKNQSFIFNKVKVSNFSTKKKNKTNEKVKEEPKEELKINEKAKEINKEEKTAETKENEVKTEEDLNNTKSENDEKEEKDSNKENEGENETHFKTSRKIRFIIRKIFRFGMTLGFLLYLYNFYLYKNREKSDPTKNPLYLDAFYKLIVKIKKFKDMIKNVSCL